jgi:hypothetical protein
MPDTQRSDVPDAADWQAPSIERPAIGRLPGERAALEEMLDYQRATLLTKCTGLTADQLKRPAVPPSQLTLLGIVRHLTDVERWWFRMHAAGEDLPYRYITDEWLDADFEDLDGVPVADVLAAYQEELETVRRTVAAIGLDTVVHSRGHHRERTMNVRWIYLHMIDEYGRHNGHADLLREQIDGRTGE